jgi:hypothetical protein
LRRALLVLALLLTSSACGGSDGDTASTTTTTAESATSTTGPTFAGDASSAFCTNSNLRGGVPDPFADAGATPDERRASFAQVRVAFESLAAVAPADIAADIAAVREGLDLLATYLERYGYDLDRAAAEGTAEERALFDDPRYAKAGLRISAYVDQVCELDG